MGGHSYPVGTLAFGCFFVAAAWLEFAPGRLAAASQPLRTRADLPRTLTFHTVGSIEQRQVLALAYRLISMSSTHASNNATRIEKTTPATNQ
jgi:hypothetical protein